MPKLSALSYYPVKSCAQWSVSSLIVGRRGSDGDRVFMVTDDAYNFRTQRKEQGGFAQMVSIKPFVHPRAGLLTLTAPHMPRCELLIKYRDERVVKAVVFDDVCEATDQGDEVAAWLTSFLGAPSRLVRMNKEFYRRVDPLFSPQPAQTTFTDGFPILLISDASLADLNRRINAKGREPVSRENFRSTFWVEGCDPYEEDTWKRIRVGGIVFDVVKPCSRCSITQVDWRRGVYREDKEPLVTLREYRHQKIEATGKYGVMFGQNLVHRGIGTIRLGQEIEILERK